MFNGIVETIGIIKNISTEDSCLHFTIHPLLPLDELKIGDSISVNGVCLTITDFIENSFGVTVVPETQRVTNLANLKIDHLINLERSLKFDSRISGHFLQGHVDSCGEVIDLQSEGNGVAIAKIKIPDTLNKYLVNKGYIAIDGMSITIIQSTDDWFTVTFIPHTQQVTIAHQYCIGTQVNIEVDMMAKHIEKLIGRQ